MAAVRKLRFNIKYDTSPGENVVVFFEKNAQGDLDLGKPFHLNYVVGGHWENVLTLAKTEESLTYQYALLVGKTVIPEGGRPRVLPLAKLADGLVDIFDHWKVRQLLILYQLLLRHRTGGVSSTIS